MQTFPIAPASVRGVWFLAILLLPIALSLTVFAVTSLGARGARFDIGPDGLRLRGDFYGRLLPWRELRVEEARRIDLTASPGMAPARRTLGTGLPGYQAGWFRLRNGGKALLYLTDRSRAVYIPTTAGYGVMVSPADPEAFLNALRARR